jgi:signal transduction histidine kinase
MALKRVSANRTLALARVNLLLGRVFSVTAPIIAFQMLSTGLAQNIQHELNQFWFWFNWICLAASYAWMTISVWLSGEAILAYRVIVIVTFISLATWGLQLDGGSLNVGDQPWIWWGVGIAGIAAIGGFSVVATVFILAALPVAWFLIQVSELGVPVDPIIAAKDATFTLLFSSVVCSFVAVLRYEASKVDAANHQAGLAAIELAKADAIVRELDRVDALVHDSVLTTLIVAAGAKSGEQEKEAELLAKAAIAKLQIAASDLASSESISISSLFDALEFAIRRQGEAIAIEIESPNDFTVPGEVAAAITESTLQALSNSIQHAGKNVERAVYLKGSKSGLKIVVKDNGRGFRPSRIPKNRLGLKLSIIGRMKSVGGRVFIDSKPGKGTNVIIEWGAK